MSAIGDLSTIGDMSTIGDLSTIGDMSAIGDLSAIADMSAIGDRVVRYGGQGVVRYGGHESVNMNQEDMNQEKNQRKKILKKKDGLPTQMPEIQIEDFDTPSGTILTEDADGNRIQDNLDPNYDGNGWDMPFVPVVSDFILRYYRFKGYEYDRRNLMLAESDFCHIDQRPRHIPHGETLPVRNWKHFLAESIDLFAFAIATDGEEKFWEENEVLI